MKKEYDFSKGIRGKFYRGNQPFQVTIDVPAVKSHPRYEIYLENDGMYRFRLATDLSIVFTSQSEYASKDECLNAIALLKQASVVAPTIFA